MSYPYSFDISHPLYSDDDLTHDEYLEALNTPVSEEDAEKIILQEQYDEEMWERRANGIETESIETWHKKREARKKFFEEWKNATPHAEDIAEGRIA
mgnify:CR=1 FL=1